MNKYGVNIDFTKTIDINCPADFECVCTDMLNTFVDSFTMENGCLGYISFHDEVASLSGKGNRLYDRYVERLVKIGLRIFPRGNFVVKSNRFDYQFTR